MKGLSVEEEQIFKLVTAKVSSVEQDIEHFIYVDIPQRAMEFDHIIKTSPLLQPQYLQQLEQKYQEMFSSDSFSIEQVTQQLSTPDQIIFDLEEFIRSQLVCVRELSENLKKWFYSVSALNTEEKNTEELEQVIASLEEGMKTVFEQLLYFHNTRGKLFVKLQKRKLFDLAKTLSQFDLSQLNVIKTGFTDIYNNLIVAYDATVKHYDILKIQQKE